MKSNKLRYVIGYVSLFIVLVVLILINLNIGSASVSVSEITEIVLKHDDASVAGRIIWSIRLPRLIAAMFLGGALTIAGFLLQTFFANPIAGPYVLGISSGAKLTVALTMVYFLNGGISISSGVMIIAAFIGSLISTGFILLISSKVRQMSILIICGVMVGYICSAITDFVVTFADDSNIVNLHNWSLGSFSGISWDNVYVIAVVVMLTVILTFMLSKPMGAYQLGEEYAQNMGVKIKAFRIALIVLSSLLSAVVTAFAGPISFVGIAVPHLMKRLIGTAKPIHMIPVCFLGGASFCLLCDVLARSLFAPTELSISSVTAVFGAPIVIYMMINRSKLSGRGNA